MYVRVNDEKPDSDRDKFIEIDLTSDELKNILKGRHPSPAVKVNGERFIIFIGLQDNLVSGGHAFD